MLYAALVSLGLAALGGAYMAWDIFRGRPPQSDIAWLHGIAVLLGIGILLYYVLSRVPEDDIRLAFIFVLVTATGGIYLASRHWRHKTHPRTVVALHGLLAVTTLVILGMAIL